jgi:hypothetical protein
MHTLMTPPQPMAADFHAGQAAHEPSFVPYQSKTTPASHARTAMGETACAAESPQDAICHSRQPAHDAQESERATLATLAVLGASVPRGHLRQAAPEFQTREPVRRWNQWPRETAPLDSSCNGTCTPLIPTTEKCFKSLFDLDGLSACRATFHRRLQPCIHAFVIRLPVHSGLGGAQRHLRHAAGHGVVMDRLLTNDRFHARRVA